MCVGVFLQVQLLFGLNFLAASFPTGLGLIFFLLGFFLLPCYVCYCAIVRPRLEAERRINRYRVNRATVESAHQLAATQQVI